MRHNAKDETMKKSKNLGKGGAVEMDELYTVEEVSEKLKISRASLYRYMSNGLIPYVQLGGQKRFIGSQVQRAIRDMQTRQIQAQLKKAS